MDGLGQDRHVSEPNLKEGLLTHRLRISEMHSDSPVFSEKANEYQAHAAGLSRAPMNVIIILCQRLH